MSGVSSRVPLKLPSCSAQVLSRPVVLRASPTNRLPDARSVEGRALSALFHRQRRRADRQVARLRRGRADEARSVRFTTLGDGKPGNAIRAITPERSSFIRPAAPQASDLTVGTPTLAMNNALSARPSTDLASGACSSATPSAPPGG